MNRNKSLEPVSVEVPCYLSDSALFAIWSGQNDNEVIIGIRGDNNNAQVFLSEKSAALLRDTLDAYFDQLPAFDD